MINLSEEEQLRAALAASLNQNPVSSIETPPISDSSDSDADEEQDVTESPSSSRRLHDSIEPPAKKVKSSCEGKNFLQMIK